MSRHVVRTAVAAAALGGGATSLPPTPFELGMTRSEDPISFSDHTAVHRCS